MNIDIKQIKTSLPYVGFVDSRQGGRPENQDSCGFCDTALGLLVVVCDGMGGGPGGRTASTVAVDTIIRVIQSATADSDSRKAIQAAVTRAHESLLAVQREKPELRGMGTTVTLLLINARSAFVAHVGDSRIYQLRRGSMVFRTQDHSMVGELVRKKVLTEEAARTSPNSNILQRAVGVGAEVVVDISELPYEKGDRFVLCTDGVWGAMNEKALIASMAKTKAPGGAVENTMIKVDEIGTGEGGHHDNFTMALVVTNKNSILKETMSTKTRYLLIGISALCALSLIGNMIQLALPSDQPSELNSTAQQDSLVEQRLREETHRIEEKLENKYRHQMDSVWNYLGNIKELKKLDEVVTNEAHQRKELTQIIDKLDSIISELEKLRDMSAGKKKDAKIKETVDSINALSKGPIVKHGVNRKELDKVVELLGNSIAKSDKNAKQYQAGDKYLGHYNGEGGIIPLMKAIKNKVN